MSSEPRRRGLLFVVSAPSGTGKTTIVERLVQIVPDLGLSRSYTSRVARVGETDGVDYNFITRERFEEMVAADAFLEWADVFGNLYGTCADDAEREIAAGRDLVLVIDVQGARKVRAHGAAAIGIFVLPPSFDMLEQRLRGRSKDAEAAIERRLITARAEVEAVRGIRLRCRERRAGRLRGSAAGHRPRRTRAARLDGSRDRGNRRVRLSERNRCEQIRVRHDVGGAGQAAAARVYAKDTGADENRADRDEGSQREEGREGSAAEPVARCSSPSA